MATELSTAQEIAYCEHKLDDLAGKRGLGPKSFAVEALKLTARLIALHIAQTSSTVKVRVRP